MTALRAAAIARSGTASVVERSAPSAAIASDGSAAARSSERSSPTSLRCTNVLPPASTKGMRASRSGWT
jgi:hypothetical protein